MRVPECRPLLGDPPFSSLCRHLHIKAATVVAHESVIDPQKQSSSHVHSEGLTFADEEKTRWIDANLSHILGAIECAETRLLHSILRNKDTDQACDIVYRRVRGKALGFL